MFIQPALFLIMRLRNNELERSCLPRPIGEIPRAPKNRYILRDSGNEQQPALRWFRLFRRAQQPAQPPAKGLTLSWFRQAGFGKLNHIITSAHQHISTSAHQHISTSAHQHISTSATTSRKSYPELAEGNKEQFLFCFFK